MIGRLIRAYRGQRAAKRGRQARGDMPRMQADDHRLRMAARQFNCAGVDQLVQGRFGRAVGIPPAQRIVAN